eukprot:5699963-Amphidinium_carterae.1
MERCPNAASVAPCMCPLGGETSKKTVCLRLGFACLSVIALQTALLDIRNKISTGYGAKWLSEVHTY